MLYEVTPSTAVANRPTFGLLSTRYTCLVLAVAASPSEVQRCRTVLGNKSMEGLGSDGVGSSRLFAFHQFYQASLRYRRSLCLTGHTVGAGAEGNTRVEQHAGHGQYSYRQPTRRTHGDV